MQGRGILITLEGGDGAGKSTLTRSLFEALKSRGLDVIETRAPGGTELGLHIRRLLLETTDPLSDRAELFLFLADRAEHMKRVIGPALQEGKIVLCDRFNDSTLAYQGVARGLDLSLVAQFCSFATSGVAPDLTFYLDLPPELGLSRGSASPSVPDRIESETLMFHESIRKAFLEMAQNEPSRIHILDATQEKHTVVETALRQLDDIFFAHR